MESNAIKHHYPEFNRAQKRKIQPYGIFSYEDRNGIMHLAFNKLKMAPNSVLTLYNPTDCRLFIEEVCKSFRLCPKYCHLQENVKTCSHYRIETCDGICREEEDLALYNEKVLLALNHIRAQKEDFVIREKGRNAEEQSFVLVKNSAYVGYGFIDQENTFTADHELETFLVPQNNTLETESIIKSYISKNPGKALLLESSCED